MYLPLFGTYNLPHCLSIPTKKKMLENAVKLGIS